MKKIAVSIIEVMTFVVIFMKAVTLATLLALANRFRV
jgi:hypothetical protein